MCHVCGVEVIIFIHDTAQRFVWMLGFHEVDTFVFELGCGWRACLHTSHG